MLTFIDCSGEAVPPFANGIPVRSVAHTGSLTATERIELTAQLLVPCAVTFPVTAVAG